MAEPADWERVGELLQRQRVRLDPRYRNRTLFSRERDINYRLAQDVETGARDNYEPSTLTHIALAYGWQPGDIESVLSGGQPDADGAPADAPAVVAANWDDSTVRQTWQNKVMEADERLRMVLFYLAVLKATSERDDATVTQLRRADGA